MPTQYFNQSDLLAYISNTQLPNFTTDTATDEAADTASNLDIVITTACRAADALVAAVYVVPFVQPFPSLVVHASIIFACEALYRRRLTPGEKNPFTQEAEELRQQLMKVANGLASLDSGTLKNVPPGFASFTISVLDGSML